MSLPAIPVPDRRLFSLLALNAALALALGFFTFSADRSLQLVIYGGYWAMLGLTLLFGWSLWRIARSETAAWSAWRTWPRWPAALVAVCGLLLLVHESFGFKILMDEIMLLGTSMSMHFDKTALVPMRGHDIQGAFQLLAGQLDKRPLFHPFLVSTLHDLTGYRPENAFALNVGLTFVLLTLTYHAGRQIAGRAAGAVAVLLLTSLPLLAQNATGGGFELLNLVMILATLLLGMRWLARRDAGTLSALCLAAVLLAQTRYESVLFLLPVGLMILWVWWRERRPLLSWVAVFAPLYLLPYALQHQVFAVRESSWELAGQPGAAKVFSLSYAADNFSHWLNFFFNTTGEQSNSLVLSVLGFLALPFFALWAAKLLRRPAAAPPARLALAIFALGLALHAALYLCYFWGKFDDPVIRRLSLPFNLTLVLAVVAVAAEFGRTEKIWRVLAALTGFGLFASSLPAMARHGYSLEYYVGREMEWRREFIAAHPERDYLFIDNNSIIWITHLVSGTPVKQALDHKENIVFSLQNRIFSRIYAFQRFDIDPATGRPVVQKDDDLGPDYQLETVWERRFTPLTVSRISRVVSIRSGPTAAPRAVAAPVEKISKDDLEKIRLRYYDQFIKKLP
ncbi:MAG: glycosyltransferase family 39 protein [Opitutae bacterium]|nr:glycosyltransferase family 39 protein [Opitutae bacterium]